jgi:hypothetical protein
MSNNEISRKSQMNQMTKLSSPNNPEPSSGDWYDDVSFITIGKKIENLEKKTLTFNLVNF